MIRPRLFGYYALIVDAENGAIKNSVEQGRVGDL